MKAEHLELAKVKKTELFNFMKLRIKKTTEWYLQPLVVVSLSMVLLQRHLLGEKVQEQIPQRAKCGTKRSMVVETDQRSTTTTAFHTSKYIEQEWSSCLELQEENIQLREALQRVSAGIRLTSTRHETTKTPFSKKWARREGFNLSRHKD